MATIVTRLFFTWFFIFFGLNWREVPRLITCILNFILSRLRRYSDPFSSISIASYRCRDVYTYTHISNHVQSTHSTFTFVRSPKEMYYVSTSSNIAWAVQRATLNRLFIVFSPFFFYFIISWASRMHAKRVPTRTTNYNANFVSPDRHWDWIKIKM